MQKVYCRDCKYWVRIETGCFYGTCKKELGNAISIWRCEGEGCKKFEPREERDKG